MTSTTAPAQQPEPPAREAPRYLPPTAPVRRADGSRHYAGISYATPLGYRPLLLDLWVPAGGGRPPVVVWIHGGAWQFGDRRYLPQTLAANAVFEALLAAGIAAASIDYRLSGEATFPAQLHDAKSAIRYLRHHADPLGLDSDRIGVWGESAGGHLAALVALTGGRHPELEGDLGVTGPSSTVQAAVDWYGVSDLPSMPLLRGAVSSAGASVRPALPADPGARLLGGALADLARPASPVTYVTPEAPPFLLVHGTADVDVPFEQSSLLHGALLAAGAESELVAVEGADHVFEGAPDVPGLVRDAVAFLAERLRKK